MLSRRTYILLVLALPFASCLIFVARDFFYFLQQCPAQGYSTDRFLAYCESKQYGDYEHGAYYLQTEPRAIENLKQADVVFLGDSRIQHAFSTAATKQFFKNRKTSKFYLLGFGFSENYSFSLDLIAKLKLSPKVFVVGVDERYFRQAKSSVAFFVENQRGARSNYEAKIMKQVWHQFICSSSSIFSSYCGEFGSTFRARSNGFWYTEHLQKSIHQEFDSPIDPDPAVAKSLVIGGREFIDHLGHNKNCVIFVSPPVPNWSSASASEIAQELGIQFVPGPRRTWISMDGSHLEADSAEVWSKQMLDDLAPLLSNCGA